MYKKLANSELNRQSIESFKEEAKNKIVVVLDNIRSLNNIGSVFRTSDAFAIESIFLCGITAQPPHREINKTALGATESVDWKYVKETKEAVDKLKEEGYLIAAVEQTENSTSLDKLEIESDQKIALIFGHEVHGVDQEIINHCDMVIEIPQFGTKHSLNISVSVGVVLWDIISKMR